MVISCISVSTYKRIATLVVGLAISAVTLLAQQQTDTIGVAAEFVHYGEAILWVKPASLLNEQTQIPFSVDLIKGDSARVYVSRKTYHSLLGIGFTSIRFCPKPLMLKAATQYRTYSQYIAYCDALQKQYPELVDCDTIGYSVNNKAIIALKFNPTTQSKPGILWVGSIHGDETQGYVLLQAFADSLLAGYSSSPFIKKLVDNTHIYLIPSINPDGLFFSNNTPSTSSTRYNAKYIDLNRDFPDFVVDDHLTLAERQPETQALINFVAKHRICLSAGMHSGAEVVNYPWDAKSALHPDDAWLQNTALAYAQSVQKNGVSDYFTDVSDNGIVNGNYWYLVNGGQQDYMTAFAGSRDFTLEVSREKWLPSSGFNLFWNSNKQAMIDFTATALMASSGKVVDKTTNQPIVTKVWTANTDTAYCGVSTDDQGYFYKFVEAGRSLVTSNVVKSTSAILDFINPYDANRVSLVSYSLNSEISLYPTLFSEFLTLNNPNNLAITLVFRDLNGEKHLELNTNQTMQLPISLLKKGFYIVSINSKNKLWSVKVVKE